MRRTREKTSYDKVNDTVCVVFDILNGGFIPHNSFTGSSIQSDNSHAGDENVPASRCYSIAEFRARVLQKLVQLTITYSSS